VLTNDCGAVIHCGVDSLITFEINTRGASSLKMEQINNRKIVDLLSLLKQMMNVEQRQSLARLFQKIAYFRSQVEHHAILQAMSV
jgi:hypothetical protein